MEVIPMTTKQKDFLLEGEQILWESRAHQFKIQEKPFSAWNLACWGALVLVLIIYAAVYVPFAMRTGTGITGILLCGGVLAFIPAILSYNSIHDCSTIINRLEYIITNKRAIVVGKDECRAMEITPDTPFKVEERPDGNQILFLGSTVNSRLAESRKLAVIGDKNKTNGYQGLVFYSIQNAEKACQAAGFVK